MKNFFVQDIGILLTPALLGYGAQAFCGIGKGSGAKVVFRPPSQVFGVVWPILYLLFGLSWMMAMKKSANKYMCAVTYGLTAILLALWIVIYGCKQDKKQASWILVAALATMLASFGQGSEISRVLLSPLIAWSLFALLMNTTEVQQL
jgi:tryptophan-rich sensory protein